MNWALCFSCNCWSIVLGWIFYFILCNSSMLVKYESSFCVHYSICLSLDRNTDNGSVIKYWPPKIKVTAKKVGTVFEIVIFIIWRLERFFFVYFLFRYLSWRPFHCELYNFKILEDSSIFYNFKVYNYNEERYHEQCK